MDAAGTDQKPRAAWTLARATLTAVFCASGMVALLEVWNADKGVVGTAVAAVLMAVMLTIQLFHFSRPGADLRSPRSYVLLGLLTVLAYVPLLAYGFTWLSLPPFVAGCVLLVLPPVAAWTSFAAIEASLLVIRLALGESPLTAAYGLVGAVVFGFVVYLLTRLASLAAELHAARNEMAQFAVAEERLRFARDVHDLLGLSLSAITLKGELAHRLLGRYPDRVAQELAEILDMARRALVDVRSAASGYRTLSLDQEAGSAADLLRASDVDVHMQLDDADLPMHVSTMLGMVLREGITNVLRHSKAEHCDITVRQSHGTACLEIVNDGALAAPGERESDSGNGIRNLSDRVAALGGELAASARPDGRFRLSARVPLPAGTRRQSRLADSTGHVVRRLSGETRVALPTNTRLTLALVNITFSCTVLGAVLHLLMLTSDIGATTLGTAYLLAVLALQLGYFSRSTTPRRVPLGYALLIVQACLVFLPLLQLGKSWVSVPGWVGGNALLVAPPVGGWLVFAGSVVSVAWTQALAGGGALNVIFFSAATVNSGLVAYGLIWLTKLIVELNATRKRLATMAVADERLRFARDLHDLLGLTLSAITLKCELAKRLLVPCPAKAADELAEVLGLARRALSDVRSVASGHRDLPLDVESQSAESVLTAADVRVRMDLEYGELPVRVRTVLAVVLREGVTNVLRHSRATHCEIVLRQAADQVSLAILNDGVTGDDALPLTNSHAVPNGHSGIRNLSERVAKVGGELDCAELPAGTYRLRVTLPL
jgi:signal transduction histidine kinase